MTAFAGFPIGIKQINHLNSTNQRPGGWCHAWSEGAREFRTSSAAARIEAALPVDEYLAELDAFIDEHNPYRITR